MYISIYTQTDQNTPPLDFYQHRYISTASYLKSKTTIVTLMGRAVKIMME